MSSFLLLFLQRFDRYVLRPSSGVCRTREPSRNFEQRPLLNPRPQKVRLEENRKAVVPGDIEKSGMADHIWKEKGNHLPLRDKVKIIDRFED